MVDLGGRATKRGSGSDVCPRNRPNRTQQLLGRQVREARGNQLSAKSNIRWVHNRTSVPSQIAY